MQCNGFLMKVVQGPFRHKEKNIAVGFRHLNMKVKNACQEKIRKMSPSTIAYINK